MPCKEKLLFNTAIITHPSDYNGLLTTQGILEYYKSNGVITPTTKLVVAQEDPDETIQRIHFHLYFDDKKRKGVTTKYFDIPFEYPIVVFIHTDKTREYQPLHELESQLGWDNGEEMVAKLQEKVDNDVKLESYDILRVAHPNIQLKKQYFGSKYEMLRYVCKQKLICRDNFDLEKEFEWLLDCKEELEERLNECIKNNWIQQCNVQTVEELINLISELREKKVRDLIRSNSSPDNQQKKKKRGRKPKNKIDETTRQFLEWLRKSVNDERATKSEILVMIKKSTEYWMIYSQNYLNYSKLINDMFKGKSPSKPKRRYDQKFWLPKKLYNYLIWLDDWVRRWSLGETMESRPKGLVLIGPSRTGKTSLMTLLGDFSYFKNIWSVENWEGLTAYTIMDDMDAGDEGKGLSFCWYKPFFGAQDAVTVTDKFKPKQDIVNGKPLIWINNYDYKETFQSRTAQDYIERNMEIVYINQPLFERPEPYEWIEGHSDYVEWDPTSTWYYQNKVLPTMQQIAISNVQVPITPVSPTTSELVFVDETPKVVEYYDDLETLQDRKNRLQKNNSNSDTTDTQFSDEEESAGRLTKRARIEN